MDQIISVGDALYVKAQTTLADDRTRVLKHDESFALFDRYGDVQPIGSGAQGLYLGGTRYLSRFELLIDDQRPLLLSSTVKEDNALMVADLTNPDQEGGTGDHLRGDTIHLCRRKFLHQNTCYEELSLRSYVDTPTRFCLRIRYEADFYDIFEVRGQVRAQRGHVAAQVLDGRRVVFTYVGLDEVERKTDIRFEPAPTQVDGREAVFELSLPARGRRKLLVQTLCVDSAVAPQPPFTLQERNDSAFSELSSEMARVRDAATHIVTSNEVVNKWLSRSFADLQMLMTLTSSGPYPYAGVPWFSTAFGRDGLIAALQVLCFGPALARGVLRFLAERQARQSDAAIDAEPGKILHETRKGEMANLGEIPFSLYYGSIDATALFVLLAGAYYTRTGDIELVQELWPAVERALEWIEQHGDADGDGLVEYQRKAESGLLHQGWKDSGDCIFHADGRDAAFPIALCEVQAYIYAAYKAAAQLAVALGRGDGSAYDNRAAALAQRFNEQFWIPRLDSYAIALDGEKRPCEVRSSNAAQCMFTGIVPSDRARRMASWLLQAPSFSGWGVRTLASSEPRFNPMSYHNGSIWPHDNSLIAWGLSRCGLKNEAMTIFHGLFEAASYFDLHRLPEVFCGFPKRAGESPTIYPVACVPQAWAAASVYLLLTATLGLEVRGDTSAVEFHGPQLPEFLEWIRLERLRVGQTEADFHIVRHPQGGVSVQVLRREGDLKVSVHQ